MRALPVPLVEATMRLEDGRRFAYAEWGAADGVPLFFLHGNPGSRTLVPDEQVAAARGVRLVTMDGPGRGDSDLHPGVTLADSADDVRQLADRLEVSRFAVLGWSAGAPHALACGAALADRVAVVGLAGPVISLELIPDLVDDWSEEERAAFALWDTDPAEAVRANAAVYETGGIEGIRAWLESPDLPPPDYRVNHELGYLDMVVASMARALAHGGAGLAWDDHAICGPWGFALGEVTVPVHLWHGEQDHLIPGRVIDYYAAHLPRVAVTRWPDEGHGGLLSRWPEVLDALCDPAGEAAS